MVTELIPPVNRPAATGTQPARAKQGALFRVSISLQALPGTRHQVRLTTGDGHAFHLWRGAPVLRRDLTAELPEDRRPDPGRLREPLPRRPHARGGSRRKEA